MLKFCRLKLEVEFFIETFELEYFFSYLDKGGGWRFEGKMGGGKFDARSLTWKSGVCYGLAGIQQTADMAW